MHRSSCHLVILSPCHFLICTSYSHTYEASASIVSPCTSARLALCVIVSTSGTTTASLSTRCWILAYSSARLALSVVAAASSSIWSTSGTWYLARLKASTFADEKIVRRTSGSPYENHMKPASYLFCLRASV